MRNLPALAVAILAWLTVACGTSESDPSASNLYNQASAEWQQEHTATWEALNVAVVELAALAPNKSYLSSGSPGGMLSIRSNSMSPEQIAAALNRAAHPPLTPAELETLAAERDVVDQLLLRLKEDQANLHQLVRPDDLAADFEELAAAAIDFETTALVRLLRFYSSSELEKRGPIFEELPRLLTESLDDLRLAKGYLVRAEDRLEMR